MNSFKVISFALLLSAATTLASAQCTKVIPANVNVISTDSIVDCSFLVTQQFLVCPGATLTLVGNSTCFNKFCLESGATIIFNDTVPNVPYGSFSFYLKSGSTLDYNIYESGPTPFIDTLVFETDVTMIDTGAFFMDSTHCSTLVFDYSNLPGAVSPCQPNAVGSERNELAFDIFPNPSTDGITIQRNGAEPMEVAIYDLLGKELEHYVLHHSSQRQIIFANRWNGTAIIELKAGSKRVGRKLLLRN